MENIMLPKPHKIISVLKETQAEYTFRVECGDTPMHGQFYMLSIPKIGEAPISVSGKGEGYVEFTIRKVGRLTDGMFGLGAGDNLFMRGPYGNSFPVHEFEGKPLVVISGGTGMCPVRTTLNYFYDNPQLCPEVRFMAGFKAPDAVLFTEELEKFKRSFNTRYCLDTGELEGFESGFVTQCIKDVPFEDYEDYNVVIVGPPAMMHIAAKECVKCGAAEEKIWVSFERKMSCAVGKCGHCKINETYVCLEGPVFNYTKAKDLLD